MNLGTIAAKMTLDISNFTSQLNLAQSQAQRLAVESSKAFQIGSSMTSMGKTMTKAVTLPLLAMAGLSVKVGNEFQAQMSRVQAIAGATGNELDKMKQQAIQLGAKTAFSAKEAAQGMENLASAGFSVNEIMNAMPGTLDLAAVSGGDVAQSADAMASSLRAFGLEANQAGHVADVFARAAADTNAETVDMAEAMKYVAPVAHSMGLSLEETAASIGIMADAGIKGSQAGTTLRGALSRIAKPTKAMVKSMDELGVSFYDANGKMVPLREQIGQLKKATAGLTQEERNRHLVTLYGQQSLSGMLALLDAGPEKLDKMTNSLINSDGAAKEMAATMQDNLASKIEQMGGAFESAAIIIQQILEPALSKLVGWITKLIEGFVNMSPLGQKMVVIFGTMVAALGPLLLIFGTVISTIVKVKTAIQFLGAGFAGTMGTIAAVIGIIYALVAVFMIAYTKSETFRNFIDKLWPSIKNGLGVAAQWAAEKLKVLWEWLHQAGQKAKEFGQAVRDKIGEPLKHFSEKLGVAGDSIKGFIGGVLEKMGGAFGKIGGVASLAVSAITKFGLAFLGITGPIGLAISLVVSFLTAWAKTGNLNADGIRQVFDNLSTTIQNVADAITKYLPQFVQKGTEILVKIIEGITKAIPQITQTISQVITAITQTLVSVLPQLVSAGMQILTTLIQGISQALPQIVQATVQIITTLLNGLIQALPQLIQAGIQIIQALIGAIVQALPSITEAAVQIMMALINGIVQALPTLIEAGLQIIMALIQAIVDNLPQIIDAGIQMLTALIQGLIQVLPQLIEAAIQILTALLEAFINALPQLVDAGVQLLTSLLQGFISVLPQLIQGAIQILASLLSTILSHLPQLLQAGVQLLTSLVSGILSVLGSLLSTVGSMMGQMIGKIGSFVGQMLSSGAKLLTSFISGIAGKIGSAVGKIASMGSQMISKVGSFVGQMASAGRNFVMGFVNGISGAIGAAANAAANMAKSAWNAAKSWLGIKSPSRKMMKIGKYTGEGFGLGITNMIRTVRDNAREMAEAVSDALSDITMDVQDNGIIDKVKDIYDHVMDQVPDTLKGPQLGLVESAATAPTVDLYKINQRPTDSNEPKDGGESSGGNITIGTIIVRSNDDVDKLSRGLYNKSKETLSGMGNIVTP